MSGKDVVMALGNDLASEGGFAWNINVFVVLQESAFTGNSPLMVKGGFYPFIP